MRQHMECTYLHLHAGVPVSASLGQAGPCPPVRRPSAITTSCSFNNHHLTTSTISPLQLPHRSGLLPSAISAHLRNAPATNKAVHVCCTSPVLTIQCCPPSSPSSAVSGSTISPPRPLQGNLPSPAPTFPGDTFPATPWVHQGVAPLGSSLRLHSTQPFSSTELNPLTTLDTAAWYTSGARRTPATVSSPSPAARSAAATR